MMEKVDFWKIFPEEGKYAMAAQFHNKRRLAVILSRWMLVTNEIL
jgi:hypothetical protein